MTIYELAQADSARYHNFIKWDKRFLNLAKHISNWSRDISTQVGAVIVDEKNRVVSLGYNGFPRGIKDNPDDYANRDIKIQKILHADLNAILFANRPLDNCTMYTFPFLPCSRCAVAIIQTGIKRVVSCKISEDKAIRWGKDIELSKSMFNEAGIEVVEHDATDQI